MQDNVDRYLKLLELKVPFTDDDLKRAYRAAVKKYHPDINKSEHATTLLQEVNRAHDFLKANKRPVLSMDYDFRPAQGPPANKVDPREQFKKDTVDAQTAKPKTDTATTLYRGPYTTAPDSISIPIECLIYGCIVYMMINGREFRLHVPANTTEGSVAYIQLYTRDGLVNHGVKVFAQLIKKKV